MAETNERTATKAAIRRAEIAAQKKLYRLDKQVQRDLLSTYKTAAAELTMILQDAASEDGSLRRESQQAILRDVLEVIEGLEGQRSALLNESLQQAANTGAGVWASLSAVGTATLASEALGQLERFIAADGLRLSDRLWGQDQDVRDQISRRLRQAIIQGESASEAAQRYIADRQGVPPELAQTLKRSRASSVSHDIKQQLTNPNTSAYSNALRVFRTEINRAHGLAHREGAFEHDEVVGMKFMLSPRHPKVDICDMHARVNRHGLGAGVYPKGKSPWPAHPNTLSFEQVVFEDEVSDDDKAEKTDRIAWLKSQPHSAQDRILGKHKAEALRQGLLKENQINTPWRVLEGRLVAQGFVASPKPIKPPDKAPELSQRDEAIQFVFDQGRETGHEWMVIYDRISGQEMQRSTDRKPGSVSFAPSRDAMLDANNSLVVVHNHPNSSAFSGADLIGATFPGVDSVLAIGHDGSRHVVQARVRNPRTIKAAHARHVTTLKRRVLKMARQRRITEAQWQYINEILGYAVCVKMDRAGLIHYALEVNGQKLTEAFSYYPSELIAEIAR